MNKVKSRGFRHGVSKDLDVKSILRRAAASVVEDAVRIRFVVVDESEVFHRGRCQGDV